MIMTVFAAKWLFFFCFELSVESIFSYEYVGCFVDQAPPLRTLPLFELKNDPLMTIEKCAMFCCSSSTTVTFFGTEAWDCCHCGNQTDASSFVYATTWKDCNIPCTGNHLQVCGGAYRLSIYRIDCLLATTTKGEQKTTETTITTNTDQTSPGFVKEELDSKIIQIQKEITVDKKTTSRYLNKKRSAADHRSSSMAIGIVGIIVIVTPAILIIMCDMCLCLVCKRTTRISNRES